VTLADLIELGSDTAKHLATLLSKIPGVTIDPDGIETNIVFFDVGAPG
jgi:threonine aldolase